MNRAEQHRENADAPGRITREDVEYAYTAWEKNHSNRWHAKSNYASKTTMLRIIISRENWFFLTKRFAHQTVLRQNYNMCSLHEGEAGWKVFNIVSAFISFIKEDAVGADKGILYRPIDKCNFQNKKCILLSALTRLVNDTWRLIRFMAAQELNYIKHKHTVYYYVNFGTTWSLCCMKATILSHKHQILF